MTGQDRANSGVYLQERHKVQLLDSYGDTTLTDNEAGAICTRKAPDMSAASALSPHRRGLRRFPALGTVCPVGAVAIVLP